MGRIRAAALLQGLLSLPFLLPGVILGLSLAIVFRQIGFEFGVPAVIVGHATFITPIVVAVLLIRLRQMDPSLVHASMDLGASPLQTLVHIVLPQLRTALLGAALLGFTLSFDEVLVTFFLTGSEPDAARLRLQPAPIRVHPGNQRAVHVHRRGVGGAAARRRQAPHSPDGPEGSVGNSHPHRHLGRPPPGARQEIDHRQQPPRRATRRERRWIRPHRRERDCDTVSATYDVIIIGAGHNGLVTAAYLARAGLKVLALEARDVLGGASVAEELIPGAKWSSCAFIADMIRPEIMAELQLGKFGFSMYAPDTMGFVLQEDGRHLMLHQDLTKTLRGIEQYSRGMREKYVEFGARLRRFGDYMRPWLMAPPLSLGQR